MGTKKCCHAILISIRDTSSRSCLSLSRHFCNRAHLLSDELDFEYLEYDIESVSFIGGSKIVWILSKFAERRREETETRKSVSFNLTQRDRHFREYFRARNRTRRRAGSIRSTLKAENPRKRGVEGKQGGKGLGRKWDKTNKARRREITRHARIAT